MRMGPSGKGRTGKGWASWKAISTALALAVLTAGTGALRAPAQQSPPPATAPPAPPAVTDNSTHPGEAVQPEKPTTIRATVELVNVPVTVVNKRGMPIIDMGMQDFQVFEDGVEQKITHFDRETRTPLRIGLILDTSNSARSQLSYEKEAAAEFVYLVLRNGNTTNQMFLQTFDASSSIVHDFTADPDVLNEKIQNLKSGGGKALYDAIYFACREKMRTAGSAEDVRRILVVLSDGLDVQSQHTLDQAVSMSRMTETMIYTVGMAAYGFSNPGDKMLDDLAMQTGGFPEYPLRAAPGTDLETGYLSHGQVGETSQNKGLGAESGDFSAQRLVNLADALQTIGRTLDEQYTIGYRPSRDVLDGTYRTIKVVSMRRGIFLRWKPGYFASPQ
jgi:VWFA-related protein